MSVTAQLWLFLALVATLSCCCFRFGLPGLYRQSILLSPSKTIRGNYATAVASVFVFVGVLTGSYVLFGIYSMVRVSLRH